MVGHASSVSTRKARRTTIWRLSAPKGSKVATSHRNVVESPSGRGAMSGGPRRSICAPARWRVYERDLRLHIRPRFDRRPLAKITKTEVQAWVAEMRSSGVPDSAVRRRFSVFRAVMTGAVEDERLVKSPCVGVKLPEVRRSDIEVLTPEEVARLAAAMPEWCRSWVLVAAWSGLRWSEMVGLRRRDVDMLRRRFVVSRQVVEVGSEFRGFDPPKTQAGRRQVPIWSPIYPVLEEQLAERAQAGKDGLVFVNTRGKHAAPIQLHEPDVEEGTRCDRPAGSPLARPQAHLRRHSNRRGRATLKRSKRSAAIRPTRRRWTSTATCSSRRASGPPRRWRRCIETHSRIGRPRRSAGSPSPPLLSLWT